MSQFESNPYIRYGFIIAIIAAVLAFGACSLNLCGA
jgi:hypothetical protein